MAFSKKMVEDRKAWLSAFVPGTFLDQRAPRIPYRDFIHKVRRGILSVTVHGSWGLLQTLLCGSVVECPLLIDESCK